MASNSVLTWESHSLSTLWVFSQAVLGFGHSVADELDGTENSETW